MDQLSTLRVYILRMTLLEYLSTVLTDVQRLLGDLISERSLGISERFPGIWRFVETVEIL